MPPRAEKRRRPSRTARRKNRVPKKQPHAATRPQGERVEIPHPSHVEEPRAPERLIAYHDAVQAFKRGYLERALREHLGNRTHAARALGLQRTYFLRLIREFSLAPPRQPPSQDVNARLTSTQPPISMNGPVGILARIS